MHVKMGYANATDRVAAAVIEAARPWFDRVVVTHASLEQGHASARSQGILRLIRQIAKQGLSPSDCDSAEGSAAFRAIADAIFSGKTNTAFQASMTVEWKHVYEAARRILDREEVQARVKR
jgi:hypothetical protein